MKKKSKKYNEKLKKNNFWNNWGWIMVWIAASVIVAIVIHFLFKWGPICYWISAEWNPGEILTYISTVSLALLAFWQNKQINNKNDIKEKYNFAIEKAIIWDVRCKEGFFYNSNNDKYKKSIELTRGFNGKVAYWTTGCVEFEEMDKFEVIFVMKNITDVIAVEPHFNISEDTNVLSGAANDIRNIQNKVRYTLPHEEATAIVIIDLNELKSKEGKTYSLITSNQYGNLYSQDIEIKLADACKNIITISSKMKLKVES